MPRRPGRTRQRWPQAKQRTAPPSTCSTSSPSLTRASSTLAIVASPPPAVGGVGWAGPLARELESAVKAPLGRRGVRVEVEAHGHAGLLPALERAPHRVEEARLEVGGHTRPQEHPRRTEDAVVPAMQHRVLA